MCVFVIYNTRTSWAMRILVVEPNGAVCQQMVIGVIVRVCVCVFGGNVCAHTNQQQQRHQRHLLWNIVGLCTYVAYIRHTYITHTGNYDILTISIVHPCPFTQCPMQTHNGHILHMVVRALARALANLQFHLATYRKHYIMRARVRASAHTHLHNNENINYWFDDDRT